MPIRLSSATCDTRYVTRSMGLPARFVPSALRRARRVCQSRTASSSNAVTPLYRRRRRLLPLRGDVILLRGHVLRAAHGMDSAGVKRHFLPAVILVHPVRMLLRTSWRLRPIWPRCFGSSASVARRDGARAATWAPTQGKTLATCWDSGSGENASWGTSGREGTREPSARLERRAVVPLCLRRKRWCVSGGAAASASLGT